MPLNHILRKCTAEYKPSKSQEKIKHLVNLDDIKLFAKKIIGNSNTNYENMQSRYRNEIWHRKMPHDMTEKWQTTHKGRSRTTKWSSHENARRKEILRDIGNWHHQTAGNERKKLKKNISEEPENYPGQNYIARTLSKGINTWADPLVRYSGPILKWTKEELKQMDQRTRKMTMHKVLHPRNDVDILYVKKRRKKRIYKNWRQHVNIDTTTRRLYTKARKKTDYSHQKQYLWHEDQRNDNNQKTKVEKNPTLWRL